MTLTEAMIEASFEAVIEKIRAATPTRPPKDDASSIQKVAYAIGAACGAMAAKGYIDGADLALFCRFVDRYSDTKSLVEAIWGKE